MKPSKSMFKHHPYCQIIMRRFQYCECKFLRDYDKWRRRKSKPMTTRQHYGL